VVTGLPRKGVTSNYAAVGTRILLQYWGFHYEYQEDRSEAAIVSALAYAAVGMGAGVLTRSM
jgi:hypothetical protein